MQNNITQLFNIKYPIIQGGMIWVSGYKLASAVSNAGGLGLIGASEKSVFLHVVTGDYADRKAALLALNSPK